MLNGICSVQRVFSAELNNSWSSQRSKIKVRISCQTSLWALLSSERIEDLALEVLFLDLNFHCKWRQQMNLEQLTKNQCTLLHQNSIKRIRKLHFQSNSETTTRWITTLIQVLPRSRRHLRFTTHACNQEKTRLL